MLCPGCSYNPECRDCQEVLSKASPGNRLRWLPYLFAAGAVFWLIELTQFAAVLAAPLGREQLRQALMNAGITSNLDALLVVESIFIGFLELAAAALHGAAYYGLKAFRAWGWVIAVIVSAAWSLVLVGIPVLLFLLRRPTRQAYGIS
jgi:hypothetical protein